MKRHPLLPEVIRLFFVCVAPQDCGGHTSPLPRAPGQVDTGSSLAQTAVAGTRMVGDSVHHLKPDISKVGGHSPKERLFYIATEAYALSHGLLIP